MDFADVEAMAERRKRRRTSNKITVRYECPLCGGEHNRANCKSLRAVIERKKQRRRLTE